MAESKDVTEKALEDLEKDITCAICHHHYTEPKVLPCCHYYCKQCIHSLALRTGMDKPFSCPECRKDTTLPQGGVDVLQTAFFITRMKGVHSKLKQAQSKGEAKCEMCSGAKAKTFCRQCAKFVCTECEISHPHRIITNFANHKTTSHDKPGGKRVNETDYSDTRELMLQTCRLHEGPMNIYCFDCNTLICRDCIVKYHHGHSHQVIKIQQYTAKCHVSRPSAHIATYPVNLTKGNEYCIKYTPTVRGRHELTVTVNGQEVAGSPFPVFVSIHPTQLGKPVKTITGLSRPYGVAVNSDGKVIVTELNKILLFDRNGKRLRTITAADYQIDTLHIIGVSVDYTSGCIYIAGSKIIKLSPDFKLQNEVSHEFLGIALVGDEVMACWRDDNIIMVYTKELKPVRQIGSEQFSGIFDVSSDEHGNLYVSDNNYNKSCVHVLSNGGEYLHSIHHDNVLRYPYGVCVVGQYVYVVESSKGYIAVFTTEGEYVTKFSQRGHGEGDVYSPCGVCVDKDGFVYVCDQGNNRVHIF